MPTTPDSGSPLPAATPELGRHVGAITRATSWVLDAVLVNLVAIITALGVFVVTSMFHIPKADQGTWEAVAGAVYVLWIAAYFVIFWSTTGQTPGARVLQIRLVAPNRPSLSVGRAMVRWLGMELAAIPLFAGYLPVLFKRRPLPDWLAHTVVVEAPEVSLAMARRAAIRAQREAAHPRAPAVSR